MTADSCPCEKRASVRSLDYNYCLFKCILRFRRENAPVGPTGTEYWRHRGAASRHVVTLMPPRKCDFRVHDSRSRLSRVKIGPGIVRVILGKSHTPGRTHSRAALGFTLPRVSDGRATDTLLQRRSSSRSYCFRIDPTNSFPIRLNSRRRPYTARLSNEIPIKQIVFVRDVDAFRVFNTPYALFFTPLKHNTQSEPWGFTHLDIFRVYKVGLIKFFFIYDVYEKHFYTRWNICNDFSSFL